jgi:hypothetical protein
VNPDELAEQLHHLVDQLARPERTAPIQPGDLVQIAADADDAYSGLPGIVQRVYGQRVHVSILRPHRGGLAFPFPLAVLSRIGTLRISKGTLEWSEDLDKSCADCRQQMREQLARATRRPAAKETSPLVRVKKVG